MKIGFVDCIYNKFDVFEGVSALASQKLANASLDRFTAPDVLKVPAAAQKLFTRGADAVLVFLTASADDRDALLLVYEKIINVEIHAEKFVIFAVVADDEWRSDEQFKAVADKKLELALELIAKSVAEPAALAENIGSGVFADFAQMASAAAENSTPNSETGGIGPVF